MEAFDASALKLIAQAKELINKHLNNVDLDNKSLSDATILLDHALEKLTMNPSST